MSEVALTLVVLRCADLERSVRFYRALGLDLTREQHGQGPAHYACETRSLVLELYPAAAAAGSSPERLGFEVEDADAAIRAAVVAGGALQSPRVVLDPDGRRIVLSGPTRWSVWRQDDSGNRFLVSAGLAKTEAERLAADLEAKGHKQTYWVERDQG